MKVLLDTPGTCQALWAIRRIRDRIARIARFVSDTVGCLETPYIALGLRPTSVFKYRALLSDYRHFFQHLDGMAVIGSRRVFPQYLATDGTGGGDPCQHRVAYSRGTVLRHFRERIDLRRHGRRPQAEPESVRRPNSPLSPTNSSERENGRPDPVDRVGQLVAISSSNSLVAPVPAPVSKGTAQTSVAPASKSSCIRDRTVLSSPVIANSTGPSTPSRSKRRR